MPPRGLLTRAVVAYGALLMLLLWSRGLSMWSVVAVAGLLGAALFLEARHDGDATPRRARAPIRLAEAVLALALVAAFATTIRLQTAARNWDEVSETRLARLTARLDDRMEGVLVRARSAAELAAATTDATPFRAMAEIRERTAIDAVAVVDGTGEAVAWAGVHRGPLPDTVLRAESGIFYPGGTLFDYLYAVSPAADGKRAIAAVLVQSGPPLRGRTDAVAARFTRLTGERPQFGPGTDPQADWTLHHEGSPVLHAVLPALNQAEWRERVAGTGRRIVFVLALLALVLLSASWLRSLEDREGLAGVVPVGALSLTLMAAPLGRTLGLKDLFSPVMFVLPIPGDIVIEGVLVLLLPLAALVATLRPAPVRDRELWMRLAIGAALVGGGFAIGIGLLAASSGPPMLRGGTPLWYVLQPTAVVLLSVLAVALMPVREAPDDRKRLLPLGLAAVVVSVGLALFMVAWWRPGRPVPTPLIVAWAVPFLLAARAVAGYRGRGDRLIRWLAAGWLAASAVIPHLWLSGQEARLRAAEVEVQSLGVRSDPYLNYLLRRFAEELQTAAGQGVEGVDLLYEAWVSSGLAGQAYPMELSIWDSAGTRLHHLPLGVRSVEEEPVALALQAAAERVLQSGESLNEPARSGGVSRVLAVPLDGDRAVTVAVSPRAGLRSRSPLAAFVEGDANRDATLELLPVSVTTPAPGERGMWQRTETGWRSETALREGPDAYHAHLEIRLPPAGVRLARGVLLVAADLLLLALLWMLGRAARGDPPVPPGGWLGWLAGFRARLIASLFAFFLLPTAIFGWAAYRALAEEVTRAAQEVAEHAVVQASLLLPGSTLTETSRRIGEDLLLFERGTLTASSVPEAAELGLYDAWMPPSLYRSIRAGEAVAGTEMREVAGRSYLVAYRRLVGPWQAVAAPVWLAARDVAVRQREFGHLVLFGALMGGVLSLALSVVVGRALARPIGELRRAAAAVGRGRLRVRLPEQRPDEFGELFASFNQMTRRLRRARAQELRTARILAWGEMARQVAHEIKNPLTPIKLSVQHIRRAYRDGRPEFDRILESNVEQILVEIERLSEIARAFSRYGAPEEEAGPTEAVDVAAITRDVLTLYGAPDRLVSYRLREDCARCLGFTRPSELREVLVNLLENARAAVGDGGHVEVRVASAPGTVTLEVRDDGQGISPRLLPRIFDPHFSTRSSGTGLGLAIVRRLVESWGGEVSAESEEGVGTVVRLTMPAVPSETDAAPTSEEADAARQPWTGDEAGEA